MVLKLARAQPQHCRLSTDFQAGLEGAITLFFAPEVVKNIEAAINRICEDIRDKKGGSGADKLDSLAKLVNSYSRLIERDNQKKVNPEEDGDPTYYAKISAYQTDRRNVIR